MTESKSRSTVAGQRAPMTLEEEKASIALWTPLFRYTKFVLTPRRLAEIRRRRGDKDASPRDYDCRCPVPRKNGIPECTPLGASSRLTPCRFRDHPRTRRYENLYDNKFGYAIEREVFDDLCERWRKMTVRERLALFQKASAFCKAEDRRIAARHKRRANVETAPLDEPGK